MLSLASRRDYVGKLTRALGGTLVSLLVSVGAAHADFGLGPGDAEKTLGSLRYLCIVPSLCAQRR